MEITASLVKELRERTGAGMMECKKALTEANGDVITEYRIAGQLRAVRVQPSRGPVYYLYDRDGDGSIDNREGDNPPVTYFRLFEWE